MNFFLKKVVFLKNFIKLPVMSLKSYFYNSLYIKGIPKIKIDSVYKDILIRYNENHRRFHTIAHIKKIFKILKKNKAAVDNFQALFFACCFHDIIYDTKSKLNEEMSSEYASKVLNTLRQSEEITKKTVELILSTKNHIPVDSSSDSKLFLDADLAILSSNRLRYKYYARAIRNEYFWVPDKDYKKGRSDILEKFLIREKIYHTSLFYGKYEKKARENIQWEINIL